MFGRRLRLFSLLGFEVRIDVSWLIVAVLIAWSLARGVFPAYIEGLTVREYWLMGIAGALGLFASIIFHELCHSVVARRFGLPINGITLFIFGGVAEMDEEPPSPRAEFYMAIAGPAASIIAGVILYIFALNSAGLEWPRTVTGVIRYLGVINLILAGFNLLPAFPLDGGRVLRAALWHSRKDLRSATRTASRAGSGFGLILIFAGVITMLGGALIGGLWWIFIGLFLRGASRMSFTRLRMRQALEGEPVRRFMKTDPVTVQGDATISELVEDYVYRHHFKLYPVVDDGNLEGCVTTREIKDIPRQDWGNRTVAEVSRACSGENTIEADADAVQALRKMRGNDRSRLMVVDGGNLVGIITLKDMLDFIALKVDLEDNETGAV